MPGGGGGAAGCSDATEIKIVDTSGNATPYYTQRQFNNDGSSAPQNIWHDGGQSAIKLMFYSYELYDLSCVTDLQWSLVSEPVGAWSNTSHMPILDYSSYP